MGSFSNREKLVVEGVPAWNRWREENLEDRPQLVCRNFNSQDLSDANLSSVDLVSSSLIGASLRNSNLTDANLYDTNLHGADLSGADLRGAVLYGAKLDNATNLSGANLRGTFVYADTLMNTNADVAQSGVVVVPSPEQAHATGDNSWKHTGLDDFFKQIRFALENKQYYLALFVTLTIPDICAAMDSEKGEANGGLYMAWFDKRVKPKYATRSSHPLKNSDGKFVCDENNRPILEEITEDLLTGGDCYSYRCAMLHQGRSQHSNMQYKRIFYFEPGSTLVGHRNVIDNPDGKHLNLDVSIFCEDVIQAAEEWLRERREAPTPEFQANYANFTRRYADGMIPYTNLPVMT